MTRFQGFVAGVLGLGTIIASSHAFASAFAVREDDAEGLGTMFSGTASAADRPATVFDNPAGMTELHGNQIEAGGALIFPTINFHGNATSGLGPIPGNTGNNGGRPAAAPNVYGVLDLSDRLKVGIAITSPFGLMVKNNAGWYGRYLGIDAAVLTSNANPSIAYKINDQLSVGGGLNFQWFQATLSQAVNQSVLGAADGLARFKGDSWGFGWNVGALLKPLPGTQVGLTYRSKVTQKLHGDLDFTSISPVLAGALVSGPATLAVSLPASTTLGITQEVTPALSVSLNVQWTQWSTLQQVHIVSASAPTSPIIEGFSDSWFTSIGASYRWSDAWTFRAGAGWDQSPVTNYYRTVALPDNDRYMLGGGIGYKFSEALSLDAAYAHYFASHASMNGSINSVAPSPLPFSTVALHGTYQLSLDYLAASLRYKF